MNIILAEILNCFSDLSTTIGTAGSVITIWDHFKNRNITHIDETYSAMRNKSKEAYGSYCAYRSHKKSDLGLPSEEKITGYWESCLQRNALPGIDDLVTQEIACKEEAEIIFPYLMEAWMEVPDFVGWLHSILIQNQLHELAETLLYLQKNLEGVSLLTKKIEQQNINYMAIPILPSQIIDAKLSCSYQDIRRYYTVSNNYHVMFRVISAEKDIPHKDALQIIEEPLQNASPIIISGNGGMGKTSLMMHAAIHWAAAGHIVLWMPLSDSSIITKQEASAFFNHLTESVPDGQRVLLCIDNPFEGEKSFLNLKDIWPDNGKIQLMMAERTNRLAILADCNKNSLQDWFDNAQTVMLLGTKLSKMPPVLNTYKPLYSFETEKRRNQILSKCISLFVEDGTITKTAGANLVKTTLHKFGKPEVSLVELIYRTLFEAQKIQSKPGSVKLDWDEWGDLIHNAFGEVESTAQLYGVVATLNAINMPLTLSLFCRHFGLQERRLKNCLKENMVTHHIEPVIYNANNDTIKPKHEVIAELFFLFHRPKYTFNDFICDLLESMNEYEIEKLLKKIVTTKEFYKVHKYEVGEINYWEFMKSIYQRTQNKTLNLSDEGAARLCLGFLWLNSQKNEKSALIKEVLEKIAPAIMEEKLFRKLYTEWGILERHTGNILLAKEKIDAVLEIKEDDCPALVELGILYTKQNKEAEAKTVFQKVIHLDPKNVPARTELGKLHVEQGNFDEAETFFRQALKIDPRNLQPCTELGKLLVIRGNEAKAEIQFKKAINIDPGYIPPQIELGNLYLKQDRKKEAEKAFCKVLKINPNDAAARKGLAKLQSGKR